MSNVAKRSVLLSYCLTFMSIYKTVLKDKVTFDCKSFVSTVHGSLVFFTFGRGKPRFQFILTTKPIGKVLEGLPQRGIRGNLSGAMFEGKNVIREGNKLIIVKGDNSPEAWSKTQAIRDAREEVTAMTGLE